MHPDADTVRAVSSLLRLVSQDTSLKRVASTGGGEYAGPCPFCGGEDRFRLQLKAPHGKKPEGERWMCRQCSPRWGDSIGYAMRRQGLDFQAALQWLANGQPAGHLDAPSATDEPQQKENQEPEINREQWLETSTAFYKACIVKLWSQEGERALQWLQQERGIDQDTIHLMELGFCPSAGQDEPTRWGLPGDGPKVNIPRGIVIPCSDAAGLHYVKIRQASGTYGILRGGTIWPFGLWTLRGKSTAFLFESELDVCLAYSTGFVGVGYFSLPARQPIKTEYQPFFEDLLDVLVAHDGDEPGQASTAKLCKLPGFHPAGALPAGKDLGEYWQATHDLGAIFEWLYQQLGIITP